MPGASYTLLILLSVATGRMFEVQAPPILNTKGSTAANVALHI